MPRYTKKEYTKDILYTKIIKELTKVMGTDTTYEDPTYYFRDLVEQQLERDLKIDADFENLNLENHSYDNNLIPIFTTPKGICYALAWMGGDWETPVHFCIYLDHNMKLRAYVPKEGNTYDLYTKAAYGYEDATDLQEERWVNLGNDIDDFDTDALAIYDNRLELDTKAFEIDIDNRIIFK